eukprot:4659830-Amphidinium_carterae.1
MKLELKVRGRLGPEADDSKEMRALNRIIRWRCDCNPERLEYEADPRHAEVAIKSLSLEDATSRVSPAIRKKA